jgi:hypothetical protein
MSNYLLFEVHDINYFEPTHFGSMVFEVLLYATFIFVQTPKIIITYLFAEKGKNNSFLSTDDKIK